MLLTNFTKTKKLFGLFVFFILIGLYFFSRIIEKFNEENEDTASNSEQDHYNPLIMPEITELAAASKFDKKKEVTENISKL